MKAFVKAAGIHGGKVFSGFGDHAYCNTIIGLFCHAVMMQDEWVLTFQNADFDTQLNRHNGFALDDSAFDLADLTLCVLDVAFDFNT